MLQGPPGTGKTSLAYAIAFETGLPFYGFNYGNLERLNNQAKDISDIFSYLQKLKPCICYIDELDSFAQRREKSPSILVVQLIEELDKIAKDEIVFIAATNLLQVVDSALIRRFHVVDFNLPNHAERERLAKMYLIPIWQFISPELTITKIAELMKNVTPQDWKNFAITQAVEAIRDPNYKVTINVIKEYATLVTCSGS